MTNLVALLLSSNRLEGAIPSELGQLKRLTTLEVENNLFEGFVPGEICELEDYELTILRGDFCQRGSLQCLASHLDCCRLGCS